MQRIYCNDWSGVAKLMLASADKLANSGVDFLICPDNIIHRALPYMEPRSPLPTLDSTRLLARAALRHAIQARLRQPKHPFQDSTFSFSDQRNCIPC